MPFDVIAVSRALGAGGEELGRELAEELGLRYVDNEIIITAAERAEVTPKEMERVEARKGLVERILANLATSGATSFDAGFAMPPAQAVSPNYERTIVEVVRETGSQGSAVIVAHGASMALAGRPGLLRVLVTAPAEVRAERIAEDKGIDQAAAMKEIRDSDKARDQFFKRFYNIDREDPTHYDLVINSEIIDLDKAAEMIMTLARE
jgi:cytidylate kinase